MKKYFISALALSFGVTVITSCGSDADTTQNTIEDTTSVEVVDTVAVVNEDEIDIDLEEIDLPTPLQMADLLNQAGMTYQDGLINNPENSYTTFYKKIANFGVYSSDLSYCALNGESQESMKLLNTIDQMSRELGFSSIMDTEGMVASFEENIGDKDALHDAIEEMEENLEDYYERNETKYILPVLFAGGWIESVYLGAKSVQEQSNENLQRQLIKEMMILDNLITGLKANPEKEDVINGLITDLEAIKEQFQGLSIIQNVDDENATVTPEEFAALTAKVEEVRNRLVAP